MPTLGPLLELGLVQPLNAAKRAVEGKETHLGAQTLQDVKGFVPFGNVWYAKAALENLVWRQVMEAMSPGYIATVRSKASREGRDWWWTPGEAAPERLPDFSKAFEK